MISNKCKRIYIHDTIDDIEHFTNNSFSDFLIQDENSIKCAYKFNAGLGNTLYDHSGNQNHGTINGATWVQNNYGCSTEPDACNYEEGGNLTSRAKSKTNCC